MQKIKIKIKKLPHFEGLELPSYQTPASCGMDILAAVPQEGLWLRQGQYQLVQTGIAIELPEGYEAQVRPRSGLAAKHGITVLNSPGTVDADYRGEIKVILINLGQQDFFIERGMRIAQLVIAPVCRADWQVSEILGQSQRGDKGFGHTGL